MWAFWRRTQYLIGIFFVLTLLGTAVYFGYFYTTPTCFDGVLNGSERGIDCGGGCARVCSLDVVQPSVAWARSFKVVDGQYNAVAYIENKNLAIGSPEVSYTFSLYDKEGLIVERKGSTVLPPDSVYPIFEGRITTGDRIPTQTFVELGEIKEWLPAVAGREQFVVEGRKLTAADSAPRLTASLRNTALEEAKNVEVIATIFDANGTALTASRTVVPSLPGRATQNIVFTWPQPIAKTLRSCEIPTDAILAIDLSGSMNDDGGDPPEPITSVLDAAESFVSRLKTNDTGGLVTYATTAHLVEQLTNDTASLGETIGGLSISTAEEVGSTNTGDAILVSQSELGSPRHNENARKVLVLLTDGLANAPGTEPEQYALDAALSLKKTNTEIYTIGLGDRVNENFLQDIASDGEHYFRAASAGTLDRIYRSITAAICEEGPAVIEIIPKTETSFQSQ